MNVLMITYSQDPTAARVAEALRARGARVVRFDTDRFPGDLRLDVFANGARLRDGAVVQDLSGMDAVWYRRMLGSRRLPAGLDPRYRSACREQARVLLRSLFASLRRARWIDPVDRVQHAHHKTLQLDLARAAGLEIPDSITTNDPETARTFFEEHGRDVIVKMQSPPAVLDDSGRELVVFTHRLREEDLSTIDGLLHCPMIFQERIPKQVELRVTVVGERLFVASVEGEIADWRRDGSRARFRPDSVPADVRDSVLRLMRAYGLTYGAIDLIRTPEGRHVFLELNSAGQWGWIERETGLPIAAALADALLGEVCVGR